MFLVARVFPDVEHYVANWKRKSKISLKPQKRPSILQMFVCPERVGPDYNLKYPAYWAHQLADEGAHCFTDVRDKRFDRNYQELIWYKRARSPEKKMGRNTSSDKIKYIVMK